MRIKSIKVNGLSSQSNMDGEYESHVDVDLILDEQFEFDILGNKVKIDRIKMHTFGEYYWEEDVTFNYANESQFYRDLVVQFDFYPVLYKFLKNEEKSGLLKKWCFSDELREVWKENKYTVTHPNNK